MGSFPAKYNNPENLQQRVGIFKFFLFFFFLFEISFICSDNFNFPFNNIFFYSPQYESVPQVSTFFVCFLR